MPSINIYDNFVHYDCLISPVNGYRCKKINIQNIKNFGFSSVEELIHRYPQFPLSCQQYIDGQTQRSKLHHIKQDKKSKNIQKYLLGPKFCRHCQASLPYQKRKNQFCSSSCSASYNNQNSFVRKTQSIKRKLIKKTLPKNREYLCISCGTCYKSLSEHQNCICGLSNKTQVFQSLNKFFGLDLSKLGTLEFQQEFVKTKQHIIELYQNHSLPSLSKYINHPDLSGGALGKIFKSINIPLRSRSNAQISGYKQDRKKLTQGKTVYQTGEILVNNKVYYYRSSYELRYIRFLSNLDIDFEMEPKMHYWCSSKNTYKTCFPDFVFSNTIVEIKSSFTFKGQEQNMKDKFKSYSTNGFIPYLQLDFKYFQLIDEKFLELPAGFEPATNHYK